MFSDSILYLSSIFLLFTLMGYLYIKFFDSEDNTKIETEVREEVIELCSKFPIYNHLNKNYIPPIFYQDQ